MICVDHEILLADQVMRDWWTEHVEITGEGRERAGICMEN
jgi:hypothetical protein